MSLTSAKFFIFLFGILFSFYIIKPIQKYTLLAASLIFYILISPFGKMGTLGLMGLVFAVSYIGAIFIDHASGRLKTAILTLSVVLLAASLFYLKYAYNIFAIVSSVFDMRSDFSCLKFASAVGISYYALSAIGYLIDVYWQNCKAEKNPADVALFIFYFPQLISGPITRFSLMREQFNRKHDIDYDNITDGIRRMLWGYFKKLVISERFGMIVAAVFENYTDHSFVGICCAVLSYAVQLYTDFSGCMDIIVGASMMFGIKLPENFSAPFFSESIQEFWQRWHITLGTWFKDYLMYPLQKSEPIQAIGRFCKSRFGKKVGKKISFYCAMVILWCLIGVWHGGTGYYFIASGVIPCVLLIISDLCRGFFEKLTVKLGINTECASWHCFKRIRTLVLISLCWFVVCCGGTHRAASILSHISADILGFASLASLIEKFGLNSVDVLIMTVGIVILFIADRFEYEGSSIFKKTDAQNFWFKVMAIYAEAALILLYGMVGKSQFIYFQF